MEIAASSSSVLSSSASTVPNSTCSRSTFDPRKRHDGDAERQRQQVEGRERRILLQGGEARHEARRDRHDNARGETADGHGRQRQARDEIAHRRARQDRMRHGIAGQAHPAQHEEDADRAAAERDGDHADQGARMNSNSANGTMRYASMLERPSVETAAVMRRRSRWQAAA